MSDGSEEYELRPDNEVESLRRRFSAEGRELAALGRRALYRRPGMEPFEVVITGVQKMWGDDEDGSYRFGVEGYTVRRIEDEWVDDETGAYPVYAASPSEIGLLNSRQVDSAGARADR